MTIKPCPFCGKKPLVIKCGEYQKAEMIECVTRNCVNPHISYYGVNEARKRWNKRAKQ